MRTTVVTDMAAPAELVFQLAGDPRRWPHLLPHYVLVREVSRRDGRVVCDFVARRSLLPMVGLGIPVGWRARTWTEPERMRIRFHHLGGATRGMEVTWRIEPTPGGCRVMIEHDFRPRVTGWARMVDALFTRPIASRTLRSFKSIAEAMAAQPQPGRTVGNRR